MTNYVTAELRSLIGRETELIEAPHCVEESECRRFYQAIMDFNERYVKADAAGGRYGGAVAPPAYVVHAFRRAPGDPDPLDSAMDKDSDGINRVLRPGLPSIDVPLKRLLNGGYSYEFFSYPKVGDKIAMKSRIGNITQKDGSSGAMVFVDVEDEFFANTDTLLLRSINTLILR